MKCDVDWSVLIPEREWSTYREVMAAADRRGIPFAIGGGLAFSAYALRTRNTKDVDLFILPRDAAQMIATLSELGFEDYFATEPYERHWIFRGHRDGVIVDLMWQMANDRTEFDERWVNAGQKICVRDYPVRLLPVEELIWSKLYVVQRDRCDWSDVLNILLAQGQHLDWSLLIERVGPDIRLLGSLMQMFAWLCPGCARDLPEWIWERMGLSRPFTNLSEGVSQRNVCLLDTRDWFGPPRQDAHAA